MDVDTQVVRTTIERMKELLIELKKKDKIGNIYPCFEYQVEIYSLMLLLEEKRRLLETIIGWMTMAVYKPHQKGTIFIDGILDNFSALVEIHKRVGFAKTIEELDRVSKELTEFSEKHPELRNN